MRVAAIAALGCLGIATAAHATPGDTLYTRDSTVNVHKAASAVAPVVMQLDRGRKLVEIKRQGSWVKVGIYRIGISGLPTGFIGNDGWVLATLIDLENPDAGISETTSEPVDHSNETLPPVVGRQMVLAFSGDPAARFKARCRIITKTGDLLHRRFDGLAPAAYRFVTAEAVSCTATSPSRSRLVVSLGAGDNVTSRQIHGYTSPTRRYDSVRVWTANFRELHRRARRKVRSM